jgi:hypothetical protein
MSDLIYHCNCDHIYPSENQYYFEPNEFCLGCEEPEFEYDENFCEMAAYDQYLAKIESCNCKSYEQILYDYFDELHRLFYSRTS